MCVTANSFNVEQIFLVESCHNRSKGTAAGYVHFLRSAQVPENGKIQVQFYQWLTNGREFTAYGKYIGGYSWTDKVN